MIALDNLHFDAARLLAVMMGPELPAHIEADRRPTEAEAIPGGGPCRRPVPCCRARRRTTAFHRKGEFADDVETR